MRIPRIYDENTSINIDSEFSLGPDGSGHVGRVLRMEKGEKIIVFNGNGNDYLCEISTINKKEVIVKILSENKATNESPLYLHLAQVISRGDKMDFTIQKSVELGVKEITPLISSRCGVRLDHERLAKKNESWNKIIISACEQCGRSTIPKLNEAISLEKFLSQECSDLKINLHPQAKHGITSLKISPNQKVRLIIGSEGGLSQEEINLANNNNYTDVLLGPRVLRTETAALTAISIIQSCFGDLS